MGEKKNGSDLASESLAIHGFAQELSAVFVIDVYHPQRHQQYYQTLSCWSSLAHQLFYLGIC